MSDGILILRGLRVIYKPAVMWLLMQDALKS